MPLTRAPLVPEPLLRAHDCLIVGDTRYRAAARLKQSLWREEQGLAPGFHRPGGRRDLPAITLGSTLLPADAGRGCNFLSPAVHAFVRRSLVLREEGACINYERLHRNLLSSEPLCFNLLAPLALNLDLATAVFRRLLPNFVHLVEGIRFETAPSRDRSDPRFLADRTAYDAAVNVISMDGESATVFVETKLSEGASGPAATLRPRYDTVSRELALHHDPEAKVLRSVALEQFWRLHLLAGCCVRQGITPRAHLLVLSPSLNRRVAVASQLYANELIDPAGSAPKTVGFTALPLEAFVSALLEAGAEEQAGYLNHRYLDLQPVFDLVLLHPDGMSDDPSNPPPTAPSPLALPAPSSITAEPDIEPATVLTPNSEADNPTKPARRRRRSLPSLRTTPGAQRQPKPRPTQATGSSAGKAAGRGGR
ncbi:hypothetical protein [Methylobacterium sp. WL116]|uniref:PGN_0703 family putative restriction endonuclease n=1 Tax=Methylobacterium sp. WL116 TaxID=2603889 RepID=UPI0011CBAC94|nr:hypothetical protein [Methylobacterium sp. WL116]TXM95371.1 hypothetical protein FV223_01055 [Methylobacterium sp. WL116]